MIPEGLGPVAAVDVLRLADLAQEGVEVERRTVAGRITGLWDRIKTSSDG